MSQESPSEQALLLTEARSATSRKLAGEERNVMLQIAGMAVAIFLALFCVLYVVTAEPPLPEYQVTLACDKVPRTRIVLVNASSPEEALAAVKAEMRGCEIAPSKDAKAAAPDGDSAAPSTTQ